MKNDMGPATKSQQSADVQYFSEFKSSGSNFL